MYLPTSGRFLQTDPIGYEDQFNLYAYVANDPINGVDPTGMEACNDGSGDICVSPPKKKGPDMPSTNPFAWLHLQRLEGPSDSQKPQKEESQSDAPCPTPPANRHVGTRGRVGAALRDPAGAIIALDVRSRALQATENRYGGQGGGNANAYRHLWLSSALTRLLGPSRANVFLNANEVRNVSAHPVDTATDTYNNFVGVALAQDSRFQDLSVDELAEYSLANGCADTDN